MILYNRKKKKGIYDMGVMILQKTYAQLVEFASSNKLIRGQLYEMIDFRTTHTIPGTANTNTTSPIEPLILIAVTTSTFDGRVISRT